MHHYASNQVLDGSIKKRESGNQNVMEAEKMDGQNVPNSEVPIACDPEQ